MTFVEKLAEIPIDMRDEVVRLLGKGDYDHEGHADCVLALYPNQFRFVATHGWYQWTGTHWDNELSAGTVSRAIVSTLATRRAVAAGEDEDHAKKLIGASRAQLHNVRGVKGMLENKIEVESSANTFDKLPDHLNVNNGTLDLRTGELSSHNQSDHLTYCLDIDYEKPAEGESPYPETWLNFLDSVGFDKPMVDFLQLSIGYTLTGRTTERAMWYLHGPPASGKSTIGEVLLRLLGGKPLATGVSFKTFTSERYGDTQMFDMAPLKPARLIVASESGRYEKINESVMKAITGGEVVRCAFKGKDHFEYFPQFKIWLTSNFPPIMDVDDDAAWDRVKLIHMPKSFLGMEDKGLKAALTSPRLLQAMLPWAVEGAMKWYALGVGGLATPAFIRDATQSARRELDTVGMFIEEKCVTGDIDEHWVIGEVLHSQYVQFCEAQGHKHKQRRSFTQSLENKGFPSGPRRIGKGSARVYKGINLANG